MVRCSQTFNWATHHISDVTHKYRKKNFNSFFFFRCFANSFSMAAILDDSLAKHYYISGAKGELKRIDISPDMIVWE